MYMNIDWDKNKSNTSDTMMSDIERTEKFNKVANIVKLKAGFNRDTQNFIIYRDDTHCYVHLHSSPIQQFMLFGRRNKGMVESAKVKYQDSINKEYTYLLCIPNEIIDFIIFDKVVNSVETIKREYNSEKNLLSDHLHQNSEKNYFFFEALLRNGISSKLYMYNVDLKWTYTVLNYSDDIKEVALPSLCKNQRPYIEGIDFESNDPDNGLTNLIPRLHSEHSEITLDDCAVAFFISKSTNLYDIIGNGLAHRQLLLCNNYYDFYAYTRRKIVECMI